MKLYHDPPIKAFEGVDRPFMNGFQTYAEYNYLRPGLVTTIKKRHFEVALRLTRDHIGTCSVIDFGCADGVFLPSLARHFTHVVGIDAEPRFVDISKNVINYLQLSNVTVICNQDQSISELKTLLPECDYGLLFLLEVMEHVGEQGRLYESKMEFLRQVARLIRPRGLVVVSVPKTVGVPFLFQRFAFWLMRLKREPMTFSEMLRAGLLCNTDRLEKRWSGGHVGFNHRKLEKNLRRNFEMVLKKNMVFQAVYLLRLKP